MAHTAIVYFLCPGVWVAVFCSVFLGSFHLWLCHLLEPYCNLHSFGEKAEHREGIPTLLKGQAWKLHIAFPFTVSWQKVSNT